MSSSPSGPAIGIIRIGISGWSYRHWRGDFYPDGLPARSELGYALAHFESIEINRTFYSLVSPTAYRRWYETAPSGFQYAIKGSRFITHNKKLLGVDDALANFFASGLLELREKLGPVLWQLGPRHTFEAGRLESFLRLLPMTRTQRPRSRPGKPCPEGKQSLHPTAIGQCVTSWRSVIRAGSKKRPPRSRVVTAWLWPSRIPHDGRVQKRSLPPSCTYGSTGPASSTRARTPRPSWRVTRNEFFMWSRRGQTADAVRIGETAPDSLGRDVYVFFDNDTGGYAPRQALELERLIANRRKP